jgi:ABC-type nitrate/sulfonate/bicarbonate transport system permease component
MRDVRRAAAAAIPPLLILAAVIGVWQVVGDDSTQIAMPTFVRTIRSFWALASDGSLGSALLSSNRVMLEGFALAVLVGGTVGVAMGLVRPLEDLLRPYVTLLLGTPIIVLTPLIESLFGLGASSKIAVVFLFAVGFVISNTAAGVTGTDATLREMANSFGARRRGLIRFVIIPSALPQILTGIRLALARSIVGMVLAELFLVTGGIGSLLITYSERFNTGYVLAITLALVLEGIVVNSFARLLERRLVRGRA